MRSDTLYLVAGTWCQVLVPVLVPGTRYQFVAKSPASLIILPKNMLRDNLNLFTGRFLPLKKFSNHTHSNFAHILTFFALKSTFLVLNCTTFITCFDNKQNRTKLQRANKLKSIISNLRATLFLREASIEVHKYMFGYLQLLLQKMLSSTTTSILHFSFRQLFEQSTPPRFS